MSGAVLAVKINYTPIGVVHSPFTSLAGMPLQTIAAQGIAGSIEIAPAFREGLADLDGFSHLILLTHLHHMSGYALSVTPYLDDQPRGIFATRSPRRPNPIGLSVVRLLAIDEEARTLLIEDVDLADGTPLLDLKPYVPAFDARATERIGWFAGRLDRLHTTRADDRFS
jgi:tRNA-Thr(GGU) m(6)t(6)A37 methyltransferase TsaA